MMDVTLDNLYASARTKHAELVKLYGDQARDEGGVKHWFKTHRASGEADRFWALACDLNAILSQIEEAEAETQMPPTSSSLARQASRVKFLEAWRGEELANAGRNLGLAIYAKGFIDAVILILSLML